MTFCNRFIRDASVLLLLLWMPASARAETGTAPTRATETVKRVLWINSYASDDAWSESVLRGFHTRLNTKGIWINYENYDLGIRYQPGVSVSQADVAALRAKLRFSRYDLIVAFDNVAANLFFDGTLKVPKEMPILAVAYLSRRPLRERIPPELNMTGVQISANLFDNLRMAMRLQPKAKEALLIAEATAGGEVPRKLLETLPEDIPLKIRMVSGDDYSTSELLKIVSELPPDAVILFQSWASAKELQPEHSYTVLPRIRKLFPGLILGKYDSYIAYGSAGGILPCGREQGLEAGDIAYRILNGERAADIPVAVSRVEPVLDFAALKELAIPASRAPEGTRFINVPPDFILRHRVELFLLAVAVVALLLITVVTLYLKRRSESKIALLFSHLPLRIAVLDQAGRALYAHMPGGGSPAGAGLPEGEKANYETAVAKAFETGFEVELGYEDDARHWDARFFRLPDSNPFKRNVIMTVATDVTRQYELEQEQKETISILNDYVGSERTLNQSLSRIMLADNYEEAVREILHILGENTGADRCYVFEFQGDEQKSARNTFAWIREGGEAMVDYLEEVDMSGCSSWRKSFLEHKPISVDSVADYVDGTPEELELLRSRKIRSFLCCGIWIDDRLHGFVGVDYVYAGKHFSDCETHTVSGGATLFQLAYDRRRQQMRLEDSASMQRQIVDNIMLPITIIDLDYRILAANASALADCGKSLEELLGTRCCDTICEFGDPPEFCPVQETLKSHKACSSEHDFRDKRQISNAQPIFDRDGKLLYILTVDIDITELQRQKHELQAAMEQAQAADRAKGYFLATVSHELRTPLNAIIGFSELLQHEGVDPDTQKDYLHSINIAGSALLNLINDVLDLSKLSSGEVRIVPVKTNLEELVREIAAVFRLRASEKGLELRIRTVNLRHPMYIDNLRMRQILFNLLGNAVKFTPSGYVEVEVAAELDEAARTAALTIRITDTGIGISKEAQPRIFDPFVQDCDSQGKRVHEGTGLGLSIIKRLLENMAGEISLESEPGKGSTFTVRLKDVLYEPESEAEQPLELPEAAETVCLKHGRVLLVDDVPINLKVLGTMLKRMNVASVTAGSGDDALEVLRGDLDFDAVLTDMWMPGMNGIELAERLRNNPGSAAIPVAVITADTQLTPGGATSFSGVLHKPVTMDSLRQLFRRIIPPGGTIPVQ